MLGRQVEITYADTRGMPAEGRTAAERLVQQNKVVAVFGEFHSPVALAEMEVFHKYGIPFMACDVWSDQITAKGYPEVFRNAPAVSLIDVTIGQWIAAAGFKNVAHHRREGRRRPGRPHAGAAGADQGRRSSSPRSMPIRT